MPQKHQSRQPHGRQKIIGTSQISCQKSAQGHNESADRRGRSSGQNTVDHQDQAACNSRFSISGSCFSQKTVSRHTHQRQMQAAHCQKMGNPIFLIEFPDFFRHAGSIAEKHGRKDTAIRLSGQKLQTLCCPGTKIPDHIGRCIQDSESIFICPLYCTRKYPPDQLLPPVICGIVKLARIGSRLKRCKLTPDPDHFTDPASILFRLLRMICCPAVSLLRQIILF